jgi:hypothetical protein
MKRHSPAPSLGHSGVGYTREAAIQFATLNKKAGNPPHSWGGRTGSEPKVRLI